MSLAVDSSLLVQGFVNDLCEGLTWNWVEFSLILSVLPTHSSVMFLNIQIISRNCCMKQRILHRIEPWIQRELQAILEDPDPSVIVHVASSLFIASLERRSDVQSVQLGVEDHFLQLLRRFLHGWTNMFWHELRYPIQIQLHHFLDFSIFIFKIRKIYINIIMRRKCSPDVLQKVLSPWKLMTLWFNINNQSRFGTGTFICL